MKVVIKINTKFIYNEQSKEYKDKVAYSLFRSVIQEFNKTLSAQILNGYKIRNTVIGDILIVGKYKKGKDKKNHDINWHLTNQLQKKLIDEGKLLYTEWKDESGNVQNNGGEKYLIFYTDPIKYSWKWNKAGSTKFTKNIKRYRFIPTRFNKRELSKKITNNEFADVSYDIYK